MAGFWAVPHFARSGAQNFVTTHYGRTLSIGEIRFNPFTLKLDVADVSLPDADGKVLLSFGQLHVALQLASLWRFGPSFSEILLDKPYVRAVIRHDGALNLADLGKGFPEEPKKPPPQSKPLRLYIGRLAVSAGSSSVRGPDAPDPLQGGLRSHHLRAARLQHRRRRRQRLRAHGRLRAGRAAEVERHAASHAARPRRASSRSRTSRRAPSGTTCTSSCRSSWIPV